MCVDSWTMPRMDCEYWFHICGCEHQHVMVSLYIAMLVLNAVNALITIIVLVIPQLRPKKLMLRYKMYQLGFNLTRILFICLIVLHEQYTSEFTLRTVHILSYLPLNISILYMTLVLLTGVDIRKLKSSTGMFSHAYAFGITRKVAIGAVIPVIISAAQGNSYVLDSTLILQAVANGSAVAVLFVLSGNLLKHVKNSSAPSGNVAAALAKQLVIRRVTFI